MLLRNKNWWIHKGVIIAGQKRQQTKKAKMQVTPKVALVHENKYFQTGWIIIIWDFIHKMWIILLPSDKMWVLLFIYLFLSSTHKPNSLQMKRSMLKTDICFQLLTMSFTESRNKPRHSENIAVMIENSPRKTQKLGGECCAVLSAMQQEGSCKFLQ